MGCAASLGRAPPQPGPDEPATTPAPPLDADALLSVTPTPGAGPDQGPAHVVQVAGAQTPARSSVEPKLRRRLVFDGDTPASSLGSPEVSVRSRGAAPPPAEPESSGDSPETDELLDAERAVSPPSAKSPVQTDTPKTTPSAITITITELNNDDGDDAGASAAAGSAAKTPSQALLGAELVPATTGPQKTSMRAAVDVACRVRRRSWALDDLILQDVRRDASGWATVRWFVVASSDDAEMEREHLEAYTYPHVRSEAAERWRARVTFVDLRLGADALDDPDALLQVSLDEIDRCRPHLLVILGRDYGYTPSQYRIPADWRYRWVSELPAGLSHLAVEVIHGLLADAAAAASPSKWALALFRKPGTEGDAGASPMLGELKRAIHRYCANVCEYSPPDIPSGDFAQMTAEALLKVLDERLSTGSADDTPTWVFEGRVVDDLVRRTVQTFVGRAPAVQELVDFATLPSQDTGESRVYVLTGEPSAGKTACLAKMLQQLDGEHPETVVLANFAGITPGSLSVRATLARFCHELGAHMSDALQTTVPSRYSQLTKEFAERLQTVSATKRVVVVLDSLDRLELATAFQWLASPVPVGARFVLSILPGGHAETELQRRYSRCRLVALPALGTTERVLFVQQRLRKIGADMSSAKLVPLIRKPDAGRPLYLIAACEALRLGGATPQEQHLQIQDLGETVEAVFVAVLARLERDFGRDLVERLLCLLACSQRGLFEHEILALVEVAHSRLLQIRRRLEPFFVQQEDGAFNLASCTVLLKCVIGRYSLEGNREGVRRWQKILATYFAQEQLDMTSRQREELPGLLVHLGARAQLRRFLVDNWQTLSNPELHQYMREAFPRESEAPPTTAPSPTMSESASSAGDLRLGEAVEQRLLEQTPEESKAALVASMVRSAQQHERATEASLRTGIFLREVGLREPAAKVLRAVCAQMASDAGRGLHEAEIELAKVLVAGRDGEGAARVLAPAIDNPRQVQISGTASLAERWQRLMDIGDLLEALDQVDAAGQIMERAVALGRDALVSEDGDGGGVGPLAGAALQRLAGALQGRGRWKQSMSKYEKAYEALQAWYGAQHPHVAQVLFEMGHAWSASGEHARALSVLQRAVAALEPLAGGIEHRSQLAAILHALALLQADMGKTRDARSSFEKFLRVRRKETADDVEALATLADLCKRDGDSEAAAQHLEKARALAQRFFALESSVRGQISMSLAKILAKKEPKRAILLYEEAVESFTQVYGPGHVKVAGVLTAMGNLQADVGQPDAAKATLGRSLGIMQAQLGKQHSRAKSIAQRLAEI